MHAVVITFDRDIPDEAYTVMCHQFADGAHDIDGLLAKAFVNRGRRSGGIYFFAGAVTAEAYLAGPILAGMRSAPAITDFRVECFDVDEVVSTRTGLGPLVGKDLRTAARSAPIPPSFAPPVAAGVSPGS